MLALSGLVAMPTLAAELPPAPATPPAAAPVEIRDSLARSYNITVPHTAPDSVTEAKLDSIMMLPASVLRPVSGMIKMMPLLEPSSQGKTLFEGEFYEVGEPLTPCHITENVTMEELRKLPAWRMWVRYQNAPKETVVAEETVEEVVVPQEEPVAEEKKPGRPWWLKTNMPAWACLWTNISAELQVGQHWTVALPIYYSGFNYFTSRTKFRTFAVQPELRYWGAPDCNGWFVGAHLGMAYYNMAFDGEKRWQDHKGHTPALGGGVAVGYRWHFTRNPHWWLEATVGGGVYRLDYDIFDNIHNGLLMGRKKRTFFGVDQVSLSVCYRFNLDKKGGQK